MKKHKVLIFIVCYNAENFIESVLERIPDAIWSNEKYDSEILIIDDKSVDRTFHKAESFVNRSGKTNITILFNPENLGYGGNQKIGYQYAINNDFDAVVLLHGDGQYAPEYLEQMITPILENEADVVLGSRMLKKADALKGSMPFYKWIGNQILTKAQNIMLGSNLAEFHTGYRAYSIPSLKAVPFECNADYFDFDTDILIQMLDSGQKIKEIPIPTYYGEEISRVNGIRYAFLIIIATLQSRIMKFGLLYHPKFDYELETNTHYTLKLGYDSSHEFALSHVKPNSLVIDFGSGPGLMAKELSKMDIKTISVDQYIDISTKNNSYKIIQTNIDEFEFANNSDLYDQKIDHILALDIIEHLQSPELFLSKIRDNLSHDKPSMIVTTGNVAFLPIRTALLFGQFNYGKRGILDLTHTRLFTFNSLRRMLKHTGYEILVEEGIPAPIPAALGDTPFAHFLLGINKLLIRISKNLFAYQIAIIAAPKPTLNVLIENAKRASREKKSKNVDKED